MNRATLRRVAALAAVPAVQAAAACSSRAPEAQTVLSARIERVEKGLLPGIVIAGRPVPRNAIADRMAALKVPGVSLAVIDGRLKAPRIGD